MSRPVATLIPAPLWTLGSMLTIQLGAALSIPLLTTIGSSATSELRLAWAAVILAIVAPPRLSGQPPHAVRAVLALGVATAAMTLCYYEAIVRIPLGMATTIDFLGPLGVSLTGSHRVRDLPWAVLAGTGVVLLAWGRIGTTSDIAGVMFAAGAGLSWGTYIVLTKRVGASFAGVQGLSVSMLVATLFAGPVALATIVRGPALLPATVTGLTTDVVATAGLALLTTVLPFAMEMAALRRLPAWQFGVLMSGEPAISALCGFLLLHQHLGMAQVAGIAAVSIASIGTILAAATPPRSGTRPPDWSSATTPLPRRNAANGDRRP